MVHSVQALNGDMVKHAAQVLFADVEQTFARLRVDEKYAQESDEGLRKQAEWMVKMVQTNGLVVETNEKWAIGRAIKMALAAAPISQNVIGALCIETTRSCRSSPLTRPSISIRWLRGPRPCTGSDSAVQTPSFRSHSTSPASSRCSATAAPLNTRQQVVTTCGWPTCILP